MKPAPIRFLFDYVSPYACLASTQIRALAAAHGRAVEPVPVLFAGMLEATGARGPAEIPAKRTYTGRHVLRLAAALGVPIDAPATHPFNPLAALRITTAIDDPNDRFRLFDALYRAAWAEGVRVDDAEVVARIATAAGLDGASLAARAKAPEIKARLRQATDEAIAQGVFRVPTMIADGELFWGVDSLPLLDRFLAGEDSIDPARVAKWLAVTPSASRKSS